MTTSARYSKTTFLHIRIERRTSSMSSSCKSLSIENPPTTPFYTLSLHDALPISRGVLSEADSGDFAGPHRLNVDRGARHATEDRKSTRLNSSHVKISYAVFRLKKKRWK